MSDNLIDVRAWFSTRTDESAKLRARRRVVEHARGDVLSQPRPPANDRDPEAA